MAALWRRTCSLEAVTIGRLGAAPTTAHSARVAASQAGSCAAPPTPTLTPIAPACILPALVRKVSANCSVASLSGRCLFIYRLVRESPWPISILLCMHEFLFMCVPMFCIPVCISVCIPGCLCVCGVNMRGGRPGSKRVSHLESRRAEGERRRGGGGDLDTPRWTGRGRGESRGNTPMKGEKEGKGRGRERKERKGRGEEEKRELVERKR